MDKVQRTRLLLASLAMRRLRPEGWQLTAQLGRQTAEMVSAAARSRFTSLDADAQVRVLVRFGQNLTVAARDKYVPGTDEVAAPAHLRRLNEIQHRLLGQVHALIASDLNRYPDDVLLSILLEHDDPKLREQTGWAFSEAIDRWSAV